MTWTLHEFTSNSALIDALSARICEIINDAVSRTATASVALSGGSTPQQLYQHLARQALPWRQVTVSLVDERWVDEQHPDSNARMIQQTLLHDHAGSACFIGMKLPENNASAAEKALDSLLKGHVLPMDLVLLGMGEDGHTASFFPHADGLQQALSPDNQLLCCALKPVGSSYARMSLTLRTLLAARHRILYITGSSKRRVLEQAIEPGAVEELPVRAVLHDTATLTEIYYAPGN